MPAPVTIVVLADAGAAQTARYGISLRELLPHARLALIESRAGRTAWKKAFQYLRTNGLRELLRFAFYRRGIMREALQISAFSVRHMVPSINGRTAMRLLTELKPDFGILYNAPIVKKKILDCFSVEVLVCHNGILPDYPGTCANKRAIIDGCDPGMTVFGVRKSLDAGPIYYQETFKRPIRNWSDYQTWFSARSSAMIPEVILGIHAGELEGRPQPPRDSIPFSGKEWTQDMNHRFRVTLAARNQRFARGESDLGQT